MSAIAFSSTSSLGSGLPAVNPTTEPAAVRHGGHKAQQAYQEGLAFEQVLVNQLTQTMTDTLSGQSSGSDGLGGSSEDASGLSGGDSDPAASTYDQMLPGALTSGIMSGGGTGIAMQIAGSLDPALLGKGTTA